MRIHSVYANVTLLRILSHTQRMKWTSTANKNFLCYNKALQSYYKPIPRIICTDSNTQPYNYETQETEKEQEPFYVQENFLKENFNIVNSRYFNLITVPHECNDLDDLLWTNEFKVILSKSSFLCDVNLSGHSSISTLHPYAWEGICSTYENFLINKRPVYECNKVFIHNSEHKRSATGMPTEEQLLHVTNRLTYSLINFFEKPHDYSIYHKNIVFQNNIKRITIKGLNAYIQSMYLMKFYGYFHFAKVQVEILKVTQLIEDGTVRVRWRVNGLPRHKVFLMLFNYKTLNWKKVPKVESEWLDGFSVFSVGKDGLIYKHICDKMMPDDDLLLSKKVDLKSKVLGLLGLAPRSPAGTLNTLIPCCKNQELISCKKLT